MLMKRYIKLEDVRDATGVSLGTLHNIKEQFTNLINITKKWTYQKIPYLKILL